MDRLAQALLVGGLVVAAATLVAFADTDGSYEYYAAPVESAPPGATVYDYDRLSDADREFLDHAGLSPEGPSGSDGLTVYLAEREAPRDLLDLRSEPGSLRAPPSYVRLDDTLYVVDGDSSAGFEFIFLVPKYALLALGLVAAVEGGRRLRPPSVSPGTYLVAVAAGLLAFGLVEWYGPDALYHLPGLAAGAAVVGGAVLGVDRLVGHGSFATDQ